MVGREIFPMPASPSDRTQNHFPVSQSTNDQASMTKQIQMTIGSNDRHAN
jgi:hypothetical protein